MALASCSYYNTIRSSLDIFGLSDFNLNHNFREQLFELKKSEKLPRVVKKKNTYTFYNIDEKKYIFKWGLNSGSYNVIEQCVCCETRRYMVIRMSKKDETQTQEEIDNALYFAFLDCVKTIVLYSFTNSFVGEKIMPDIYNFGFCYKTEQFYLMMESIPGRSDVFIDSYFSIDKIVDVNSFIINIYRKLEMLNSYGLQFRHGDLKYNNVLVHSKNQPLFIDFSFTSFKIPGTSIYFESQEIEGKKILNFHNNYFDDDKYNVVNCDKLNITHDLILFIMSLYCMTCFPSKFEMSLLMKSSNPLYNFILDGYTLYNYIEKKYKISSRTDFIRNNIIHYLYFENSNSIDIVRDSKNGFMDFNIKILFTYADLLKYVDNNILPKIVLPKIVLSTIKDVDVEITKDKIDVVLPTTEISIMLKSIESNTLCSCEFVDVKKTCKHRIQLCDDGDNLKRCRSETLIVD